MSKELEALDRLYYTCYKKGYPRKDAYNHLIKEISILELLKSKVKFDEKKRKYIIEIEADDFNSSEEWDEFKRRWDNGQIGN